jgi:electron transfer flavoprotein beta subunit
MPAFVMGTQLLGAPRYPSLRGIMQARSKPIDTWSLADIGVDPGAVGLAAATTRTLGADKPAERAGATFVRESADVAVAQIVDFLAARRLV